MKALKHILLILIATGGLVTATAAEIDPSAPTLGTPSWLQALIPFLTPGLLALVKLLVPKIPKPALPILAPLLGAAMEIIGHFAGVPGSNVIAGMVLGAAGVAVREAYDQSKKRLTEA